MVYKEHMNPQAPKHKKRGPDPKPESIRAAMLVIERGWSHYAAAHHCGVTIPTVSRQVRRIKAQLDGAKP